MTLVGFSVCICWTTVRRSTKWTISSLYANCLLHGLPDCVTRWFASFLCGRQQRTKIGNKYLTGPLSTLGFCMELFGPVGFIIHIYLHTCLPACTYLDDCTLWDVHSTDASHSQLQRAAIEAVQWSSVNCMDVGEL